MSETAGMAFYVVAHPEDGADEAWRMRHADGTVNVMSAFFKAPHGAPVQEPDGTYEVRAPAPSSVSIVRQMLTEHEGLVIVREEPLTGTFTDLLTTEEGTGRQSPQIAARIEELFAAGMSAGAARWQAYEEQAQDGQCECCAAIDYAHSSRPCIICGHTREG